MITRNKDGVTSTVQDALSECRDADEPPTADIVLRDADGPSSTDIELGHDQQPHLVSCDLAETDLFFWTEIRNL